MGSGDGVVKLFDSSTSKYHWEVNSDPKYPKYASDSLVPRLTFSFHSVLHEKEPVSVVHTSLPQPSTIAIIASIANTAEMYCISYCSR